MEVTYIRARKGADIFFLHEVFMNKEELENTEVNVSEVTKEDVINLEDFFTKDNSEKGVWFEPNINGKIGIEFLVIGAESDEAAQLFADYDKDMGRIEEIKDAKQKNEETRKAIAGVASKIVKGIRSASGKPIMIGGKELKYDAATTFTIMYNSPSIANKLIRFSRNDTNFMEKKYLIIMVLQHIFRNIMTDILIMFFQIRAL